jgi:hypothetical protein
MFATYQAECEKMTGALLYARVSSCASWLVWDRSTILCAVVVISRSP